MALPHFSNRRLEINSALVWSETLVEIKYEWLRLRLYLLQGEMYDGSWVCVFCSSHQQTAMLFHVAPTLQRFAEPPGRIRDQPATQRAWVFLDMSFFPSAQNTDQLDGIIWFSKWVLARHKAATARMARRIEWPHPSSSSPISIWKSSVISRLHLTSFPQYFLQKQDVISFSLQSAHSSWNVMDANVITGFSFFLSLTVCCVTRTNVVSLCAAWLKSIICQVRVRALAGGREVIWDKKPLRLGIGKGLRQSKLIHIDDIGGCICELYFIPSGMKRFVTDGVILFPCTAHECSPSCFPSLTDVGGGLRCTPLSFNWFGCLNPLGMVVGFDGGNGDGGVAASCCVEPGKRAVEDS